MGSPFLNWLGSWSAFLSTGGLLLVGTFLVVIGLFASSSRGRRRCPGCWYDMAGAAATFPLTCPECGLSVAAERTLHRTRRRWSVAEIGLLLMTPLVSQLIYLHGWDVYYTVAPTWKIVEDLRFGDTLATRRIIRDHRERGQHATITHRGVAILEIFDYDITFGQRDWSLPRDSIAHKLGAGDDLNRDGVPELVIFAYSGGAHCCYTVTILELADPPRIIATIDAQNGMGIKPVTADPARLGQHIFDIPDQSFDYWYAPHAASPMPSVFYRLVDHHLAIDLVEMLRPAPDSALIETDAARIRTAMSPAGAPFDADLWRVMLELTYSGHESLARPFFDKAWPPDRPGKDAFFDEYRAVLEKSLHYRHFTAALEAQRSPDPTFPAATMPAPLPPKQR